MSTAHPPGTGHPMPDWRRSACALMLMSLPLLVYGPEGVAGLVGLAWLSFSILVWGQAVRLRPARQTLANIGAVGMAVFPLLVLVVILVFGGSFAHLDNPSRMLLLLPVAIVVAGLAPSPRNWFYANAVGGIFGGAMAIYQVQIAQASLATGLQSNPNKFSYISAVSALACLAATRLDKADRPPLLILAAGGGLSVAGLLLSGTRGAWLAFCCALGGWFVLNRSVGWRLRVGLLAAVTAGAIGFAYAEGQVIQQRWDKTSVELEEYFAGGWDESSIGERFELWRGALVMIQEHPVAGVGLGNYNDWLRKLVEQGRLDPQIADHGHAHNEFLMWWSTGGVVGFLGVAAALFGPLIYFTRQAARRPGSGPADAALRRHQSCSLAGSLIATQTVIFCLFDAFFYIQFASVYYALTMMTLIGLVQANSGESKPGQASVGSVGKASR